MAKPTSWNAARRRSGTSPDADRGSARPGGLRHEIAVIHHTDCGSTFLADPAVREGFAARGYNEADLAWLPATDPAATVRADVTTLLRSPQISPGIHISGYVYHTAQGTLDTIVQPTTTGHH